MTLEELQNKKVTITLNKTFCLGDDLPMESLIDKLEDQKYENLSNEQILNKIIDDCYGSSSDLDDVIEYGDFKVTIHD